MALKSIAAAALLATVGAEDTCKYPGGQCFELRMQKCQQGPTAGVLSIHGLWAEWQNGCDGAAFDPSLLASIQSEMETKWVSCPEDKGNNAAFWAHEWSKHGTCSGLDQLAFFTKGLALFDAKKSECPAGDDCSICLAKDFTTEMICPSGLTSPPPNKVMLFENFMKKFDRQYETEFEKGKRFQVFSENVDMIYDSNSKNRSYTLGITENADQTFEEWRASHLTGYKPVLTAEMKDRPIFQAPEAFAEPDSVDWVAKGGVTSVKNQGTCGSCWTFSTVGALEGAMSVSGRKMVDLSMQHILACDKGGNGCGGGAMDQAFDWVGQNGVPSLADEPYLCKDASTSDCQAMKCAAPASMVLAVGDVVKHTDVASSENALEAAVAQQPVSVAIEADKAVFQHYTSGVLTNDACGSALDHGVLAVGYGVDNGQKYWKVKNSWGTTFGEDGYIRIEKGDAASGGECGIRKMASFPTLKASTIVV